jgi:SpoVK/Ycf46/Vps4 family AAA+-type ATPase
MPAPVDFPFSALLSSPNVKRARSPLRTDAPNKTPLVIHIPKIYSLFDVYGGDFLKALRDAIVGTISDILVISTTDQESKVRPDYGVGDFCNAGCGFAMDDIDCFRTNLETPSKRNRPKRTEKSHPSESTVLRATGTNSRTDAICMAPIGNRSQRNLFDTHTKLEETYEQENTRLLQRSIRRISVELRNLPIVQPFADWSFLEGTPTQKKLVKQELREKEAVNLVYALHRDSKEEHIKEAILRIGRREKALDDWCDSIEDEARASKWSTFPTQAQSTIRQIEKDYKFKWEQRFLDLLINPDDVEEGWSQIALESDVKELIVQLIHQPSNTGMHSYGILKHGRVAGGLLYGPPGTGKTHLARVLSRESKAIMICASAADIENKYVGETEKAIQGLFSLGRMLSPCTIFIDEADALFRSRKSEDRGWERTQMNQLLYEMDGLKKSKSPPFVLLATNFPRELDHAVLRRVPSRIHIGLPSPEARRQIFQICLADEMLHPDVDLCYLVEKSRGYSGSDIQTVCVQAALICDTIVGDDDARRFLKQWHFEKAFQRSAPTVSKTALAVIRTFAKEFDPAALDYM